MQHEDQQMLQKLDGQNPASVVQCYTRLLYDHTVEFYLDPTVSIALIYFLEPKSNK